MNTRDLYTLETQISNAINLKEPYKIHLNHMMDRDAFEVKFFNSNSRYKKPMFMCAHIDGYSVRHNPSLLIDIVKNYFEKFKNETGHVIDFSGLRHITQHINGHPLEGKICF